MRWCRSACSDDRLLRAHFPSLGGGHLRGGGAAAVRAAVRQQLRPACGNHRLLLRDPGGELEPAGGLHRTVLARPSCLCRRRRLYVGPARLSLGHPVLGRHSRRRRALGRDGLRAGAAGAAHAGHLSRDRDLGLRRDGACLPHRRLWLHARRARPQRQAALRHRRSAALLLHVPGPHRRRAAGPASVDRLADRLFHARHQGRRAARQEPRHRYDEGEDRHLLDLQRHRRPGRRLLRPLHRAAQPADGRLQRDGQDRDHGGDRRLRHVPRARDRRGAGAGHHDLPAVLR